MIYWEKKTICKIRHSAPPIARMEWSCVLPTIRLWDWQSNQAPSIESPNSRIFGVTPSVLCMSVYVSVCLCVKSVSLSFSLGLSYFLYLFVYLSFSLSACLSGFLSVCFTMKEQKLGSGVFFLSLRATFLAGPRRPSVGPLWRSALSKIY